MKNNRRLFCAAGENFSRCIYSVFAPQARKIVILHCIFRRIWRLNNRRLFIINYSDPPKIRLISVAGLKGFLQSNSLRNPDWITCLKLFYHIVNTFRKVPGDIFMISIKYFERYRYFWNTKDFRFALMGFWPKSIRAKWKSFVFWHWKTQKNTKKVKKAQKHRVPPCDLAKKPKITRGDPMFFVFFHFFSVFGVFFFYIKKEKKELDWRNPFNGGGGISNCLVTLRIQSTQTNTTLYHKVRMTLFMSAFSLPALDTMETIFLSLVGSNHRQVFFVLNIGYPWYCNLVLSAEFCDDAVGIVLVGSVVFQLPNKLASERPFEKCPSVDCVALRARRDDLVALFCPKQLPTISDGYAVWIVAPQAFFLTAAETIVLKNWSW